MTFEEGSLLRRRGQVKQCFARSSARNREKFSQSVSEDQRGPMCGADVLLLTSNVSVGFEMMSILRMKEAHHHTITTLHHQYRYRPPGSDHVPHHMSSVVTPLSLSFRPGLLIITIHHANHLSIHFFSRPIDCSVCLPFATGDNAQYLQIA